MRTKGTENGQSSIDIYYNKKMQKAFDSAIAHTTKATDPICRECRRPRALALFREGKITNYYHPYCARMHMDLHGVKMKRI